MTFHNLISFLGIFALAFVAWAVFGRRRARNTRVVLGGIGLQLLFAFFVFAVPAGSKAFLLVNDAVVKVLESAQAGTRFLFGRLALPPGAVNEAGEASLGHFLIFQSLPTIVFFAAFLGVLYYTGIMPFFVRLFARVFSRTMRISGAEALSVSSNIFVGVESSLVVKPYLAEMTVSELGTILAAGMATIASTVLALYVAFLHELMPTIAGHLVSASIIAAPAAVVMAKLVIPETGTPKTMGLDVRPHYAREDNVMVAVINGAESGMKLLAGIVSLLLAVLGLLAFLDMILGWAGGGLNRLLGLHFEWSIKSLLGYAFYPFAALLGLPGPDILPVAKLLGERVVATEVVAYRHLADLMAAGGLQSARSAVIASYALCGFAHFASLAIFVGGTAALAPTRIKDLSRVGLNALIAATLACLMTGAVAGVFATGGSALFR